MSEAALTGGCLCGAIRYSIQRLTRAVMCHCRQCQQAQGVGFACNFAIPETECIIQDEENLLTAFRSSATKQRMFCSRCGSPLYSKRDDSQDLRIRAGSLDDSTKLQVTEHIFADDAPLWSPINDRLPTHKGFEPTRK